ncbi:MAG: response regulator [Alphaproteobacteria bacterium]
MSANIDNLHVIVADNNYNMRRITRQALSDISVSDVYECKTCEDVIQAMQLKLPDILILSWDLAPKGGIELVNYIRKSQKSPSPYLPIIMSSEATSKEQVFKARDAGINEFLVRPFSTKALLSRIQTIIENPRPFVKTKTFFGPDRRRRQFADYPGPERRGGKKTITAEQIASLLNKS